MKLLTITTALLLSASAFSADFIVKIDDVNCTITNGKVVRTQTYGSASFTETKTVSLSGIESLVKKAAEVSSDLPAGNENEIIHKMNYEGKTYVLNFNDSKESQTLIRLTSRICR